VSELEFSVVVPVFNSEASLHELFTRLSTVLLAMNKSYELIFVDDGSSDHSWEVMKQIKQDHPENFTAIRLGKNFGQHNATFCGFSFAKGNYVITIDDDLQCPPEEIPKLISKMEATDAELVYGLFKNPSHSIYRNIGSRSFKSASNLLGRSKEGSSFRLISRNIIENIIVYHQNFVFIDEILHWYTDSISYVFVEHHPRKFRRSGYSRIKIMKMVGNLMYYYTTAPLKLMVYGGMLSSVIFFFFSLYFIYRKIIHNVPLGYTSLIVAILFSTSLILLSLGVIGEYLSRIYQVQNKKPLYSVKKVI
jgi:polyisoprenyl-phosphate glycosyltransferase